MQSKCDNCGCLIVIGSKFCCQCGLKTNTLPIAPLRECEITKSKGYPSNKGQNRFAIVNTILGLISVVLIGAVLGIIALHVSCRSKIKPDPNKELSKAANLNLAAVCINAVAIAAVIILITLYHPYIFPTGYIYY